MVMSKEFGESFKKFDQYFFQKIGVQKVISNGNTDTATVQLPSDVDGFLVGYGYSWFTATTYQLNTGRAFFPSRTDQDGSPAIPMQFSNPIPIEQGGQVQLSIANGDTASHTYNVIFIIYSSRMLNIVSTGSDLSIPGGSSSGVATNVAIVDSTGTQTAPVDSTLGLTVNPKSASTLRDGTLSATTTAAALGASTSIRCVIVANSPTSTQNIIVGNATTQNFVLGPGQWEKWEVANLNMIYVKSASGTQTVLYNAW